MSFKIHPIQGYIQTTYLIENDKGLLLLDTGTSLDAEVVLDFIENSLKRPLSDLKLIALSHAHPDHTGGLNHIQKKTKAPLAASKDINLWYKGVNGFVCHKVDLILTLFVAKKLKKKLHYIKSPRRVKIDYTLNNNDGLPYFEDWRVYKNDGHTQGDLSFYNNKTIYVGDNLIKLKRLYKAPYPMHNPTEYIKTLEFYKKFKTFILAHSEVCEPSAEDLQKVIKKVPDRAKTHLSSIKSLILSGFKLNT